MRLDLAPDRRVVRLAVNARGVMVSVLECGHSIPGRPRHSGERVACRVCAPDHFFAPRPAPAAVDDVVTCPRCRLVTTVGARFCPRCGFAIGWA